MLTGSGHDVCTPEQCDALFVDIMIHSAETDALFDEWVACRAQGDSSCDTIYNELMSSVALTADAEAGYEACAGIYMGVLPENCFQAPDQGNYV